MCHEADFSSFSVFPFFLFGNVWDTFMPCNDIKEMLKLYIFYAVCGVGVFGSHLIIQILTSSHFPRKKEKFEVIAIANIEREPEAARELVRQKKS